MALGIYISIPFCRTKCSYCNFASGVFSKAMFARYVEKLCADLARANRIAEDMGGEFERRVDSVYLGGGTPTVLSCEELSRVFKAVRENFEVSTEAEVTVECAPGTLTAEMLETVLSCGVNRVSLGVQSFVDEESRAVGRLHTREVTLAEIERLRAAGISNINVDLIAGLPHQTEESWKFSLSELLSTGVPHASVYMLEVDEDSRLGRELIAGGTKYHAHFVPDEDLTADLYVRAVEELNQAGLRQYEISNFARGVWESKHNLKYWLRQPYMGFGVDAHSMLEAATDAYVLMRAGCEAVGGAGERPCAVEQADVEAVRFSTADSLEEFLGGRELTRTVVSSRAALEEEFFLGLRLNRGVNFEAIARRYRVPPEFVKAITELTDFGLLQREGDVVRLTARGRLLSNEVFEKFVGSS